MILPRIVFGKLRFGERAAKERDLIHGARKEDWFLERDDQHKKVCSPYKHCKDCNFRYGTYVTPEILRDHGFVGPYARRWIFRSFTINTLALMWIMEMTNSLLSGLMCTRLPMPTMWRFSPLTWLDWRSSKKPKERKKICLPQVTVEKDIIRPAHEVWQF